MASVDAPGFGKIETNRAYLVEGFGSHNLRPVLQIHRVFQRSGIVSLIVSIYVFLEEERRESLVLRYKNWENIGTTAEWEEVPLEGLRIIRACRIHSSLLEGEGVQTSPVDVDESEQSYSVQWGISRCELRKLRNQGDNVEVDSRDLSRVSSPLRVHNYNCGIGGFTTAFGEAGLNVVVGTEADQLAFESWKVFSPPQSFN